MSTQSTAAAGVIEFTSYTLVSFFTSTRTAECQFNLLTLLTKSDREIRSLNTGINDFMWL